LPYQYKDKQWNSSKQRNKRISPDINNVHGLEQMKDSSPSTASQSSATEEDKNTARGGVVGWLTN